MRVPALVHLVLIASTTSLVAQTSHSPDISVVKHSIDAGNATYIAAFKKADAKALSQVYDPRGARLNQGGVVVRGRKAIQDDVGKFVATVGPVRGTLESKEIWLIDDNAYETGLWSYTFQPQGKAEQHIGGHYVTVWKKQPHGSWKIWADMGVPGT